MSAADLNIPEEDRRRQAVSALRGYVYQAYASALTWAELDEDETLLLEVAEDFAVIAGDALTAYQIKDAAASGPVTLRNSGVLKTLDGFWRLSTGNPGRRVRAVFLTTAEVGREKRSPLSAGLKGLEHWRTMALEGSDLTAFRLLLSGLPLDPALLTWLAEADDNAVRTELLRPIRWAFGRPALAGLDRLLIERLTDLCRPWGLRGEEVLKVRDAVLVSVLSAIVGPEPRTLDRASLHQTLDAASTMRVSLGAARNMIERLAAGGDGVNPARPEWFVDVETVPPPGLMVERTEVSSAIRDTLATGAAVWLHGVSGSGKTTAALDAMARSNRRWHIVELRGLSPDAAAERLRAVRRLVREQGFGGLVLDDAPSAIADRLRLELSLLWAALRQADAGLILTGYREPSPALAPALAATVTAHRIPALTEAEVGEMIALAGGSAKTWRTVVRATTGGHPQLAAARVTGLQLRGWPTTEQMDGILPSQQALDVDAQRDAVRDRLVDDLPEAARILLYRLTLLAGGFDRAMAVAVGAAHPSLAVPGQLFDILTGPWVETTRLDWHRVSPLLSGAAAKTLSSDEHKQVHRAVCAEVVGRRPIPGSYLLQLLTSGLLAGDAQALRVVAIGILSAKNEDAGAAAQELEPFVYYRTDAPLIESDLEVAALLRLAQLTVAIATAREGVVRRILDRLSLEAARTGNGKAIEIAALFKVLSAQVSPLPPCDWFPLLRHLESVDLEGLSDPPPGMGPASAENPATFLFLWRTTLISGLVELEQLFDALSAAPEDVRKRYLAALDDLALTRRTLIQSPWVKDADREGFDAEQAVELYGRLHDVAVQWGDIGIALECIAAQVTLLSEYATQHARALDVLAEAETAWPDTPRLQRERTKILFRLGRHDEVVTLSRAFLATTASDAIERAHALREMAVSLAQTGELAEAAAVFDRAAVEAATIPVMLDMQAGLVADRALVEFSGGARVTALRTLTEAARIIDGMDVTTERGEFVLRTFVGLCAWVMANVAGPAPTEPFTTGLCSGVVLKLPWDRPPPPITSGWYMLATIERRLGDSFEVRREAVRRIGHAWLSGFEITFSLDRLELAAEGEDPVALAEAVAETLKISAFLESGADLNPEQAFVTPGGPMPWAEIEIDLAKRPRATVNSALGGFAIRALMNGLDWPLDPLAEALAHVKGLEPIAVDIRAARAPLRPDSPDLQACLQSAAMILGAPTADASHLTLATYRLWEWLTGAPSFKSLEGRLVRRIAAQWIHLAENAQFALRSPRTTAGSLRAAARDARDARGLAALLLAADGAVPVQYSEDIRARLRARA